MFMTPIPLTPTSTSASSKIPFIPAITKMDYRDNPTEVNGFVGGKLKHYGLSKYLIYKGKVIGYRFKNKKNFMDIKREILLNKEHSFQGVSLLMTGCDEVLDSFGERTIVPTAGYKVGNLEVLNENLEVEGENKHWIYVDDGYAVNKIFVRDVESSIKAINGFSNLLSKADFINHFNVLGSSGPFIEEDIVHMEYTLGYQDMDITEEEILDNILAWLEVIGIRGMQVVVYKNNSSYKANLFASSNTKWNALADNSTSISGFAVYSDPAFDRVTILKSNFEGFEISNKFNSDKFPLIKMPAKTLSENPMVNSKGRNLYKYEMLVQGKNENTFTFASYVNKGDFLRLHSMPVLKDLASILKKIDLLDFISEANPYYFPFYKKIGYGEYCVVAERNVSLKDLPFSSEEIEINLNEIFSELIENQQYSWKFLKEISKISSNVSLRENKAIFSVNVNL